MSKFLCKCGFLISDSIAPNDIEFWVFSDEEWQENQLRSEEGKELLDPILDVYLCTGCKRIHIFKKGESKPSKIYRLEE